MSLLSRLLCSLFVAATVAAAHAAEPGVDVKAEVNRISKQSREAPVEALAQLEAIRKRLGAGGSYEEQQTLLRAEVRLKEDLGRLEESYVLERTSLELALAHGDAAGAALARLGAVREMVDAHRLDDAQALLDKVTAQAPANASVVFKASVERIRGGILNLRARFDEALAAYLRSLRLLQALPGEGGRRAALYARIAQVYINTDNPAKALDSADLGLAEETMSLWSLTSLQFTRGRALIKLGRDREGIDAYEKALATATRAGLSASEAVIRGNIADYYLMHHDYVRAERAAREALVVSEKVKEPSAVMMARANLGFALMGQGKIAEGTPYVDAVIAHMRKGKLLADLEALLDEKGRMLERAGQYQRALAIVREQQSLQQQSERKARDRAIAALQEEFDAKRRSQQIVLLERENKLKDAELSNRRTVQLATTFAAMLTVLAGAVVYVMYRRAARSNARLTELNVQLEFRSTHDALTGLHNRRSLTSRMTGRVADGSADRRSHAEGVDCFVLLDVDHFKSINDRWGHGAGDAVLVEVARRLAAAVRESDMVVRWGGEEFMIHAPGMAPDTVAGMAGRILETIGAQPVDGGSCEIPVTLTAGIVALPPAADAAFDWQCAVRLADWALYQGKTQGRNQARIVTRLHAPAASVMAALEGDAAHARALLALDCVHGPRQDPARPAPAVPRDAGGAAGALPALAPT
ncbi:GGDEF domain-containing protein [Massilia sp. TW-1]|uniref:diguanylate cyclase n=1 Tax=Telluria antibiotica TaxID=2717319 RepID=A0ABX0PAG0_9BURK|nr:tetratricopeptide repeat-containing diguanylate cyclase [Telluria antibiotica]NIA53548.1 GGDEF domain-containing protein [Telluria antibiotica]